MNDTDRLPAGQERAHHRLVGACAGCGSPEPDIGTFAMRGPYDGPGAARWVCQMCMALATFSQRQRDCISRTLALPAADTDITVAGRLGQGGAQ